MRPCLELVCASDRVQNILSGFEAPSPESATYKGELRPCIQMVRIVQTKTTTSLLQLFRRETLQRGLSGDWHEHGQLHWTMR